MRSPSLTARPIHSVAVSIARSMSATEGGLAKLAQQGQGDDAAGLELQRPPRIVDPTHAHPQMVGRDDRLDVSRPLHDDDPTLGEKHGQTTYTGSAHGG